tara:strand:+ start:1385 stop:1576 length:192 start_codon:yes stop_codon:yes gene_type:complete
LTAYPANPVCQSGRESVTSCKLLKKMDFYCECDGGVTMRVSPLESVLRKSLEQNEKGPDEPGL